MAERDVKIRQRLTDFRLGRFEEIVLLAVGRLGENASGVSIRREIAERNRRDVSAGALYTTLDRQPFARSRSAPVARAGRP